MEKIVARGSETNKIIRLTHAAEGFCTEAGEFMDGIKKFVYYGKPLDEVNLIEELGDILWYVAIAANALCIGIDDVMAVNIRKMRERYGEKFSEEAALNRNIDEEKKAMEHE
jgi:NTP pyrophosphatase (non-canonical NTP hydrolase)